MRTMKETPAELERESRRVLRRAALNMARLTYEGSAEALDRQFDYIRGIMQGRKAIMDMMLPEGRL